MSSSPRHDDEPTPDGDWTTTTTLIAADPQPGGGKKRSRALISLIVGASVFSILGLLF